MSPPPLAEAAAACICGRRSFLRAKVGVCGANFVGRRELGRSLCSSPRGNGPRIVPDPAGDADRGWSGIEKGGAEPGGTWRVYFQLLPPLVDRRAGMNPYTTRCGPA